MEDCWKDSQVSIEDMNEESDSVEEESEMKESKEYVTQGKREGIITIAHSEHA